MKSALENAVIVAIFAGIFMGCIAGSAFTKSRLAHDGAFDYLGEKYLCSPTTGEDSHQEGNTAGDDGEGA